MHKIIPLTESVFWIGVNDRETELFEALWPIPRGVSYNAYLIQDEKTALIETVKRPYVSDLLSKIRKVLPKGRGVDYLVLNHMEPDHSGSIDVLKSLFPEMRIVANRKTVEMLAAYYGITSDLHEIADGDTLKLGRHTLRFLLTPMVHWPETMMTLEETGATLFSGDAFGGFGALEGGLFDDEVDHVFYEGESQRYFANIIGKFSPMVQRAIEKLQPLEIARIAPAHGPVWRRDPACIIDQYDRWSRQVPDPGVVVVYGSMYENTKRMAEATTRGIAEAGVQRIVVHNASRSHLSYMIADAWRYRALVLGSATYDIGLFPPVKHLIEMLEEKGLKNRELGLFGSYGWSGGAVKRLREFAAKEGFSLVEPVVEVRGAPDTKDLDRCLSLGCAIGERLRAAASSGHP